MLNQLLAGEMPQVLIDAQNSPYWTRIKRHLLVLLALWMSYFLLVNWFVHSLNKIEVPLLGIPLGYFLALQGAAVVFVAALFRFARSAD